MTRIVFVRHGSTLWNKEKRAQGHSNNPLDEEGFEQARLVAARLQKQSWDGIYSSDLLRARQTAEIISSRIGITDIVLDSRLREIHGGMIEGTTDEERVGKWGENWRDMDLGIESPAECMARGKQCIEEMAEKYIGQSLLVISHRAIIRHTLKALIPDFQTEELLLNTSITEIVKQGDGWNCIRYNCTEHLASS